MQKMFNLWSQRDLSLYGKITIAKILGLSKMIFSSACLPTPSHIVSSINKMVTAFVWNNKPAKIKRESMMGPKEKASNILFGELKILYGYNSGDPRCLLLDYFILLAN